MFKAILIANRGEIAVRIARTCREMGIKTVGVYSEADREALHVQVMDEVYPIGPAPSVASYLRQDKLIEVARRSSCEAVHPGYGFLAENASFASAVIDAGLTWVGPPPKVIAAMGSKTSARKLMMAAGVPVVPGSDGAVGSPAGAIALAQRYGYPVLLKASAGGGGKGMRVVENADGLEPAFDSASREALAAFGDGALYVEKFLLRPRHIEFQILADRHGNVMHLGERECSLQRRHQKIIEESPSAVITSEVREAMGRAAVAAAKSCAYENAGTVEMLLASDGQFYFLEMNTRLQVEHPVTEEVTGYDLVRLQMEIASGSPLGIRQSDVQSRGHAIEVRVYAEDVPGGFLPSTGRLTRLRPGTGPGIREDSGMHEGAEISRYYDPMISKLIARAEERETARKRLLRALTEYEISGVRTNIAFCRHILESECFGKAEFHTRTVDIDFVESYAQELRSPTADEPLLAGALARLMHESESRSKVESSISEIGSNWAVLGRRAIVRD